MKVYVVTQGEYSAYHIVTICADRRIAAKTVAALHRARGEKADDYGAARYETHEVLETVPQPVTVYHRSHNRERTEEWTSIVWPWESPPVPINVSRWESLIGPQLSVFGTDKGRVDKVFFDEMARLKAVAAGIA